MKNEKVKVKKEKRAASREKWGMKRGAIGLFSFFILLSSFVIGCSNMFSDYSVPVKERGLTITVGGGGSARTALPDTPLFSKYELTFEGPGVHPMVEITGGNTAKIDGLTAGEWTITAKAFIKFEGVDELAATGSNSITINPAVAQNLTINISSVVIDGPDGTFVYDISFPAGITGELSIALYGSPAGGVTVPLAGAGASGSVDLKPGYYLMIILLEDSEGRSAGVAEIVHIYSYMETKKVKAFTAVDFAFKPVGIDRYIALTVDNFKINGEDLENARIAVFANEGLTQYLETQGFFPLDTGTGKVGGNVWTGVVENTPVNNEVYIVVLASVLVDGGETWAVKAYPINLGTAAAGNWSSASPYQLRVDFGTVGFKTVKVTGSFLINGKTPVTGNPVSYFNANIGFYFEVPGILGSDGSPRSFDLGGLTGDTFFEAPMQVPNVGAFPFPVYYSAFGFERNEATGQPASQNPMIKTFTTGGPDYGDEVWQVTIGDIAQKINGTINIKDFDIDTAVYTSTSVTVFTADGEDLGSGGIIDGSFEFVIISGNTERAAYGMVVGSYYDSGANATVEVIRYTNNFTIKAANEADQSVGALMYNAARKHPAVTFNLNGGNVGGNTADVVVTAASNFTIDPLEIPVPVKAVHGFDGWNTAENGSGSVFNPVNIRQDITVYAQWEFHEVTGTFNVNGGMWRNGTDDDINWKTVSPGVVESFPAAPIRHGYRFDGWKIEENGSNITVDAETILDGVILMNEYLIFYPVLLAQWVSDPSVVVATVTFNANGGSWGGVTTQTRYVLINDTVSDLTVPNTAPSFPVTVNLPTTAEISDMLDEGLYKGFASSGIFEGWNTQADGEGSAFTASTPVTGNITVYAQWKEPEEPNPTPDQIDLSSVAGATILDKAFAYINANAGTYILMVGSDITTPNVYTLNNASNVRLIGAKRTPVITKSGTGNLFQVTADNAQLYFYYKITLKGNSDNTSALVYVSRGIGAMWNEVTITGNGGRGVHVYGGSSEFSNFSMSGGTISNNAGGGVYVQGIGTLSDQRYAYFSMSGGTISGNGSDSLQYGGGVWVRTTDTSNAIVTQGWGNFNMSGGIIANNTAKLGGGVYVDRSLIPGYNASSGAFRKTGGIIYGSEAAVDLRNTATDAETTAVATAVIEGSVRYRSTTAGEGVDLNTYSLTNWGGQPGSIASINSPVWLYGSAVSLVAPAVGADGVITAQGWQISDNGTSGWTDFTPPSTADASYNGKYLRYYATVNSTTSYSNTVMIIVLSSPTEQAITIAMWDIANDGWDTNAALRINVNGSDLAQNARLASGGSGSYVFVVNSGDIVKFFWVLGGQWDTEIAFAVYYMDDPPDPMFVPATGVTGGKVLVSKRYNDPAGAVGNGTLMGEFEVK